MSASRPLPGFQSSLIFRLLALLCALLPALPAAQPADGPRTYTLGAYTDNYPYSFLDSDNNLSGFSHDLSLALEETMNVRFQRVVGTTPEIGAALRQGRLDAIQTMAHSREREEQFLFPPPYLPLLNSILVRKGETGIRKLEDLRGRKVLVHRNSLGDALLKSRGLEDSIEYVDSVEVALRLLNQGRGDAVIATRLTAVSTAVRLGLDNIDRKGIPLPMAPVSYSYAVRKDQEELRRTIEEGLAILNNSGEFNRIYQKWFGHIERGRYTREQVVMAVSVCLGIALLVAMWAGRRQQMLKRAIAANAAQLRLSEERYRRLFESTQEGLMLLGPMPEMTMLQSNHAAHAMLRLPQEDPTGKELLSLGPTPVFSVLRDAIIGATIPGNSSRFEIELPFAGSPAWLHGSVVRIEDGLLVVLDDITEAREARERLERSEQQLRQTQKLEAIGTLASGIAHDFNNILTGIIGNAELARMDLPGDHPVSGNLSEILLSANRARQLVRQILTFSRRTESRPEPLCCSPILAEVINFIRSTAPANVQIRHLALPCSPEIEADATQLHQVMMNLCTNALHAMRGTGGLLELSEEVVDITPEMLETHPQLRAGRFLRLSVRDTGCGMPPHVVQRIFEPFFTTKPPGEGTGLGLSVVHGIIQAHRGALTVYSQPGEGTVFRIHFPITSAAAPARADDAREIPHGRGERVLFVDDEAVICRAAEGLLRHLGYTPLCFQSARDALVAFSENPGGFDILVSDLSMPGTNGIALAAQLRALRPELPVVIASGYIGDEEQARARAARIHGIIAKPLSLMLLAEALQRELTRARVAAALPPAQDR